MPAVEEHLTDEETREICLDLLNTIKIPRNMSLLKQKLPASQFENAKVQEDFDEDNYEDDFEKDITSEEKQIRSKKFTRATHKPPKIDRTERVKKVPSGLPPTAPSQKVIPPMPQSNRNQEVGELNISPSKVSSRQNQNRKVSKTKRAAEENLRKKRRNPKTMEAQRAKLASINQPPKKYRMHSKDGMKSKRVSEIYRMRAKEVENQEKQINKELRHKYQNRIYNPNNKYLSRDYASAGRAGLKNLQHQQRVIIDPTQNAQKLNQMIGQRQIGSQNSQRRRYQPLSENYRGTMVSYLNKGSII